MPFKKLKIHPTILKTIEELGYQKPTAIQQEAIPAILEGADLQASAQTGTGKTAAFILPALTRLVTPSKVEGLGPRVLILVPTRELAMQVANESIKYSKNLSRMKTVCLYGGAPYPVQNRQLSRPYEILVATPGRLIDHFERGRISFDRLEIFILDEADRMLDMGFIQPVEKLAAATPKGVQTLMFSATLKGNVLKLSKKLLNQPKEINLIPEDSKHENIQQFLCRVDDLHHKFRLLDHFLSQESIKQVVIFSSTKSFIDQLVTKLRDQGHQASPLHGDMDQRDRTRTITKFRQGITQILVATDVAARGIDIASISHVINFDLPRAAEDYVHRIGRTGRAEAKGVAISFATHQDSLLVKKIEHYTSQKITPLVIPGLEAKVKASPKPAARPTQNENNKSKRKNFHSKNRYSSKMPRE